jgi:hypothetical protein
LGPGDDVLCSPFVGVPCEPLDIEPALIRPLAYVSGDGHLSRDGKTVGIYTTVDAEAPALDAAALGFKARVYSRERGNGRRPEIQVRIGSKAFHRRSLTWDLPSGASAGSCACSIGFSKRRPPCGPSSSRPSRALK